MPLIVSADVMLAGAVPCSTHCTRDGTIANWAANFVVTLSFLTLLDAITPKGVFFLFAALTLVALFYFAKRVPETKQRSLQQIERDLGASMVDEGALEADATR